MPSEINLREVNPSDVPASVRMQAEKLRMGLPSEQTPEKRYEKLIGKLPNAAKLVAPGTMGEAGFMGVSGLAAAGVALAPETFGTSVVLAAPLIGSAIGGALEDPNNRLRNAAYETAKGVGQEVLGGVSSKALELGGRFLGKSGILSGTAERIGKSLPSLFHNYPLKAAPTTARGIEDTVAGNRLIAASGKQIDRFAEQLENSFGKYSPGAPSKLVSPSSGVAAHYTAAVPPSGKAFLMPDISGDQVIIRPMGIKDAIMHVRELQKAGIAATGVVKQSGSAPLTADIAHQARDALVSQLNATRPGLGDAYRGVSSDYGLARQLQKVFAGGFREDRQLDQPKLLNKARSAAQRIDQLKPGMGQQLREAISPTGEAAIKEQGPGIKAHVGESGLRSLFHPPIPYKPETTDLLPFYARLLAANPQLRPLFGALGYQAVTGALELK